MVDTPNTNFINFVDSRSIVQYTHHGRGAVPLDPTTRAIDVTGFRRVSIRIGSTQATSCRMFMGKIRGATLASAFTVPLDGEIHTFEVVGPEMSLSLEGAEPDSTEQVELWVYLRS